MIRIGVKYCGGCNPDYDRVDSVSDPAKALEDVTVFDTASTDAVDFFLVVHGCRTGCADVSCLPEKPLVMVHALQEVQDPAQKISAGTAGSAEPVHEESE